MNTLNEMTKRINAKRAELKNLLREEGTNTLRAALKELFDRHPTLTGVRWYQYTPYFNDGDPCVFGVRGVYYTTVTSPDDPSAEDGDYGDGYHDTYFTGKDNVPAFYAELKEFAAALDALDDGLQEIFGDHARITASRDGIKVEEYDHE